MNGFKSFLAETTAVWPPHLDIDRMILQLYSAGKKIHEIEETTGKYRSYIYGLLNREGVRPGRLNQARELTLQLAGSGVSVKKIAEITAQTERNVRSILSRHRLVE
jgi:hypothetical protein